MTNAESTGPPETLLAWVAATHQRVDQVASVHDQAIRDAKKAGHPITRIAGTLGISNRMRLYAVLDKDYDDPLPAAPTPAVFLRGAGAPTAVWDEVETAIRRRGLMVVKDRQLAWHLARGGIPVVLLDFSTGSGTVTVGLLKARWKDVHRHRTIGQLLPREERERLTTQGAPDWFDTPVTIPEREAELPFEDANSVQHIGNQRTDPDELARAVISQLP